MLPPVPGPIIDPMAVFAATSEMMNAHNEWHDVLHRKANYVFDVKDFGAVGDGITDDTAAIQACFDAAFNHPTPYAVGTGTVVLPPGEYLITDTLTVHRAAGLVTGYGTPTTPAYHAGFRGTAIKWGGPEGSPMILVTDSRCLTFTDFRLQGSDAAPPSYGFEMRNEGGSSGSNEYLQFRDLVIGEWPWTLGDTGSEKVAVGMGWTGNNGNNDQMYVERVQIVGCDVGVSMPNGQSVWGKFTDCLFSLCNVGISTDARTLLVNPMFNACGLDMEVTRRVTVEYLNSENCGQLATLGPWASLVIRGGQFQVTGLDSGVLIDMHPSAGGQLILSDVYCAQNTPVPTDARIVFGPSQPDSIVGNFTVKIDECAGLHPDMLDLQGTFWASQPKSQGSVEWSSTYKNDRFRFRNELSRGGRTVLDYGIWENE